MWALIFICVGVAILILCCAFVGISIERKRYNNGICPKCGEKLILFCHDSLGERGYGCSNWECDYTAWVSYRSVDKNHK